MPTNAVTASPHVIHFSTVHPPFDTRIFHRECATLAAHGYRVTLYAPGAPNETHKGVEMRPVPQHKGRLTRATLGPLWMLRELWRQRAEVYHFHDPELLPIGITLAILRRTVVYDAHEWVKADVSSKPYLHPLVAKVMAFFVGGLEQIMERVGAGVVVATPTIAEQFRPGRATVINNYPDLAELSNDHSDLESYLARPPHGGYVGGLNLERCGEVVLEAAALAHAERSDFVLRAAGSVDDIELPTASPAISYHGVLARPEVATLLGEVRFGLVLLRPLPNTVDALPTKFFEYAAAGLPVIVSRSTRYLDEIARELSTGVCVDESDPLAVRDAMLWMLDHSEEAAAMGARGQAAVREQYNWAMQEPVLLAFYDRLLEPRR